MAIEPWKAADIADLAELAKEIAVVLKDAAELAAKLPGEELECELATVRHHMPDMHERVMKLAIRVNRRRSELEKAGRVGAQAQVERVGRAKKK